MNFGMQNKDPKKKFSLREPTKDTKDIKEFDEIHDHCESLKE